MLDEEEENLTISESKHILNKVETIQFKKVSFAYSDSKENVISDVTFQVVKGDIISVEGKTGAGKSTLIKVISGIYKRDNGDIFIPLSLKSELKTSVNICRATFTPTISVVIKNAPYTGCSHRPEVRLTHLFTCTATRPTPSA